MGDLNWHRLQEGEWAASFPGQPHIGDFDGENPDGSSKMYPGTFLHAVEDCDGEWHLETIEDEADECITVDLGIFGSFADAQEHAATLSQP
ncbi:hypothetical protein N9917_03490 [Deltaproteobacteria bacterium]|nr:hypothetical protein [Deltaproteobacteria bacterium]